MISAYSSAAMTGRAAKWICLHSPDDGFFAVWTEPGVFGQVRLAEAGHPEWPGGKDLRPDAVNMKLTGKRAEEVFPSIRTSGAALFRKGEALEAFGQISPLD